MKADVIKRIEEIGNEMLALAAEMKKRTPSHPVRSDEQDCRQAMEVIRKTSRASTSHFQRQLGWGYNHAAKILDLLQAKGVVGPQVGAGPREIFEGKLKLTFKTKKRSK